MSDSILVQQSAAGYGYDAIATHPAAAAARVVVALLWQPPGLVVQANQC